MDHGADNTVRVWDAETDANLAVLPHEVNGQRETLGVIDMAYSPDERRFVSTSCGMAWIWDAETFECLEVVQSNAEDAPIAAGARPFPGQVHVLEMDTMITSFDGEIRTYFPIAFSDVASHPTANEWSGCANGHVYTFAFEGNLPSPSSLQFDASHG